MTRGAKRSGLLVFASVVFVGCALPLRAESPAGDHLELDPSNFSERSHVIDNKWLPMKPGLRLIYDGMANEDGEAIRRSVVTTYTDMVKVVAGVRAAVMIEEDFNDNKLIERELAFRAQDKDGNVWHIGELTEVFDEREFVGGRVWFAGQPKGSKSGILMWRDPQAGMVASQGYSPPPFNWTDRGRVAQVGLTTKVAAGNYENVIVVDEWDEETPAGVFQTKYYAPGVGNVRVGFRGPDPDEEELELVKIEKLDAAAMEKARQKVAAVEERACIYCHTRPAERSPATAAE
jgi:hypothetical protein